jgi:hypothetical protein
MGQDNGLDERIHKFMARKEHEHPELKESVDVLYHDLTTPHFASHFHSATNEHVRRKKQRHLRENNRMNGMHYAF